MNKFLALQKDVFDINKVTVVGSPTITSDGVVTATSGYGTNCPWIYDIPALGNNWEIIMPYYSNATEWHSVDTILREMKTSYSEFSIGSYGSMFYIWLKDINGTNLSTTFGSYKQFPMPFGKMLIKLKCNYIEGKYVLNIYLSQNDGMWILDKTITSDVAFFPCENTMDFCFMVHATDEGFINLPEFKIYSNNQLIYSPTKPTYLLERRKPKVWNKGQFTIVGNPSISEDGIASGFVTNSSYIETDCMLNPTGDWKYEIEFTTSNDVTSSQTITSGRTISSSTYGLLITVLNRRLLCYIGASSKHIIDASTFTTVQPNTKYKWMGEYKNGTYYLSLNGNVYKTLTSTEKLVSNKGQYYGDDVRFPNAFLGSINLKSIKYYTDNNLVFDGGAETYVYDPSKFTIVGSPTITEYGVASGFSASNFLKIPKFDISKGFIIQEKFRCSSIKGSATLFSYTVGETSETRFGIIVYFENNGTITVNSTSDGVSFAGGITTKTAIVANNDYIIKLIYNGSTLSIYLSQDEGKTFTLENSKQIVLYNQLEVLKLGINAVNTSSGVFNTGSIDLKQFSITVDNKEVFTGAKENYYMLRR